MSNLEQTVSIIRRGAGGRRLGDEIKEMFKDNGW